MAGDVDSDPGAANRGRRMTVGTGGDAQGSGAGAGGGGGPEELDGDSAGGADSPKLPISKPNTPPSHN